MLKPPSHYRRCPQGTLKRAQDCKSMPPNKPLVTDGPRRCCRLAERLSCGARSSPLGMSAGWLVLQMPQAAAQRQVVGLTRENETFPEQIRYPNIGSVESCCRNSPQSLSVHFIQRLEMSPELTATLASLCRVTLVLSWLF